ncbi:MAG: hypothetical protein AAFX78_03345 [Cyanobacteria bacterium J06638_20]
MKFEATSEQVQQIAANAVNASKPMGLGYMQYDESVVFPAQDFSPDSNGSIYLDYVGGRMVKLNIRHLGDGLYEISDNISADYQSWIGEYATSQALVGSVISTAESFV